MTASAVSLLVPVRGRISYAERTLGIVGEATMRAGGSIIVVETGQIPQYGELCRAQGCDYVFERSDTGFHKTKLLNRALERARTDLVAPYDIDLFPLNGSLERHISAATVAGPQILVAGYRLMFPFDPWPPRGLTDPESAIGSENKPRALFKSLVNGERFGVVPMFWRRRLLDCGAWNEGFVAWGAEDQEMIERYLGSDRFLALVPDAVYGHLSHEHETDWRNEEAIARSRALYYSSRPELKT